MRVIAGLYRGRRLKVPPGVRTRPTADRVREALFSILGDVEDARVADLFAGSGALGIVEDVEVFEWDALRWLETVAGSLEFDVVFLDPPYSSAPRLGARLTELVPGILSPNATIVTESDKRAPLVLDLPLDDERVYGD